MTCPICGGKTAVIDTRGNIDHVIRRRKCIECEYTFRTTEMETEILEKIIEGDKQDVED